MRDEKKDDIMLKDDYLMTDQFAKRIGVHPQTVRQWIKKGLIEPHHKTPSGRCLFTEEQVEEYFGNNKS